MQVQVQVHLHMDLDLTWSWTWTGAYLDLRRTADCIAISAEVI